ncbi:MAG: 1-(5-phosphoribosyl)-5-[(5-phosphoribosylamino)methylideneamino]imidazole-4-carboxamide isomerase [Actinobacteria bacterium]|nr:1-(5-phosphoribosyl)-5-[(5-phosphoribosylamino)methylideneamino]imidazole-4-carboxamide isomerase [Actinomycetota bacterium]
MLIIPAIDIINGACVRLTKGDYSLKKKYFDNPLDAAENFKASGAGWLHIVDLDGAKTGSPKNLEIAKKIKEKTDLRVEYGGGIRDMEIFREVMSSKIDRAVIGTKALEDKIFLESLLENFMNRFILSLDFDSDGAIFKHGWQQKTQLNIFSLLPELQNYGIEEIIITNISRDGTLEGIDFSLVERVLKISRVKLIIAGGVSDIEDLKRIKNLEKKGINGVIIGKAIYEGRIDLIEAIKIGGGKS